MNGYAKYLDMPAAIDFYLVKEFIKEHDSDFFGSTYFSWNDYTDPDSKFEMGPEWDADRSAGNKPLKKTEFTNSPKGWFMRGSGTTHPTSKTGYYAYMAKDKAFIKSVEARWAQVKPIFKAVGDSKVNEAVNQLGVAVSNDRSRWPGTSGRPYPHRGSYSQEITYVKNWYKDRYKWMNGELK